jgi:hypothetical protein
VKRKISRYAFIILYCFLGFAALTEIALIATAPDLSKLPPLRNGDLVFRTQLSLADLPIMLASQSLLTHMGMIKIASGGKINVVEGSRTVRETPLADWVRCSAARRLLIARIRDLPAAKAGAALDWAKKQYGKPYDYFYLPDDKAFYCSELVYDAFKKGADISIGKMTVVGDLPHISSAPVQRLIESRWQYDPLCLNDTGKLDKSMTFETCLGRIMKQKLVTPASLARDARMDVLYSNLP